MRLSYVQKLHRLVIHEQKASASWSKIFAEGRQIRRTPENKLISVCKSCFSPPH
jgi:hypothetical protein